MAQIKQQPHKLSFYISQAHFQRAHHTLDEIVMKNSLSILAPRILRFKA